LIQAYITGSETSASLSIGTAEAIGLGSTSAPNSFHVRFVKGIASKGTTLPEVSAHKNSEAGRRLRPRSRRLQLCSPISRY
jgi:hypothetical protein